MKKSKKLLYGLVPLPIVALFLFLILIFIKDIIWIWKFNYNFWELIQTNIKNLKFIMLVFLLTIIFYCWYLYLILFKFKKLKSKKLNPEQKKDRDLDEIFIMLKEINLKLEKLNTKYNNEVNSFQETSGIIDKNDKI